MKNIKYVLVALLGISLFSCEDAIDIVQPGENDFPTTFQTVNDLQLGLNRVYGLMSQDTDIAHGSIWTDEVRIGVGSGGQGLTNDSEFLFAFTSTSGTAEAIWQNNYLLIMYANRLLDATKIVTAKPGEEEVYKYIVAQTHILRAWGHFKLLSYYSTDLTNLGAQGVILMDHTPAVTEKLGRSTNGEIYSFIESDLVKASEASDLSDLNYFDYQMNNNRYAERTFITSDFVKAFKARMYAYKGEYDKALPLAQELIDTYGLTPRSQYAKIWTDAVTLDLLDDEVIFKLERVQGDALIGNIWNSQDSSINGVPIYEVSTDMYGLLSNASDTKTNPIDIRRNSIISATAWDANNTILPIAKYPGSQSINLLNDAKVFRTSEMVFIKAEALAAAGNFNGVASTLQTINNARMSGPGTTNPAPANPYLIPVPANAEQAWKEILKQRRIELSYEGHRYLDVKRLGAKAGLNVYFKRNDADCLEYQACELEPSEFYKMTFPIPQAELQGNATISSQQNPGY